MVFCTSSHTLLEYLSILVKKTNFNGVAMATKIGCTAYNVNHQQVHESFHLLHENGSKEFLSQNIYFIKSITYPIIIWCHENNCCA